MFKQLLNVKYVCLLATVLSMTGRSVSGVCPNIQTFPNFEPQKFMGKWYEIMKYPNIWQSGQKCVTANYQLNPNGTINVTTSALLKLIDYPMTVRGLATPNDTDSAKLDITFNIFGGKSKLWVIETDYVNYALLYSCTALPLVPINIENAWIVSRKSTLDPMIVDLLKTRLTAINSPIFLFYATDQLNCPKMPSNPQLM